MKRFIITGLLSLAAITASARLAYVNINATGAHNGTSWANAFNHLDTAVYGPISYDTVWVANGLYKIPGGIKVASNVKIYGGFTGTETALSQRNWRAFGTVIDGDVGQPGVTTDNANCLFGVTCDAGTLIFTLDGFKLVNTYGPPLTTNPTYNGEYGAIRIGTPPSATATTNLQSHHVEIQNCWFADNNCRFGSAINIFGGGGGDVIVNNCRFDNNTSWGNGGAIYNAPYGQNGFTNGAPGNYKLTVTNCTFRANSAAGAGGAIWAGVSSLKVASCSFIGNSAARGGAIADSGNAQLTVWSSLFAGNKATGPGGAHYSLAPPSSGSLYRSHAFYHCTFAHNLSGGSSNDAYTLWLRGSSDTLRNSILWGNAPGTGSIDLDTGVSGLFLRSNLIQGAALLAPATRTFTFNPGFLSPGTVSAAPFPLTLSCNYRLNAFSPAIDTAQLLSYPPYATRDLDSLARLAGPLPDLGAYEWKSCSLSSAGITISASGPDTFCAPGSVTYTASSGSGGSSFSWNGGPVVRGTSSYTATASGQVVLVSIDSGGCRSASRRNVAAVAAPSPVITISGTTLRVPAVYGSYQWYVGGVAIPGATADTVNALSNGVYTVKVTTVAAGCAGTSAAFNLRNLEVGGGYGAASVRPVRVYPNPAGAVLYIEGGAGGGAATLSTPEGRVVRRVQLDAGAATIGMGGLSSGIYLITITAQDGTRTVQRIIKE